MGPLNYFVAGAINLIDQYGYYGILQGMRLQGSFKVKRVGTVRVKPRLKSVGIPSVPLTAIAWPVATPLFASIRSLPPLVCSETLSDRAIIALSEGPHRFAAI